MSESSGHGGRIVAMPMGLVFSILLGLLVLVIVNIVLMLEVMRGASTEVHTGRYAPIGSIEILDTETGRVWRRERDMVADRGYWALEAVETLHEKLPAIPAAVQAARDDSTRNSRSSFTPTNGPFRVIADKTTVRKVPQEAVAATAEKKDDAGRVPPVTSPQSTDK